jgi:hypothetical protein
LDVLGVVEQAAFFEFIKKLLYGVEHVAEGGRGCTATRAS